MSHDPMDRLRAVEVSRATEEMRSLILRVTDTAERMADLAAKAVREMEVMRRERDMSFGRVDELANEVQTERNARLALAKENVALIAELELLRARVTQRGAQA